jgi:uncharacterized protein YjeT (DUF2065 family)
MFKTLLIAIGLMLILECLLPSLNPQAYKRFLSEFAQRLSQTSDHTIRYIAFLILVIGAIIVYMANYFF